MGHYSLAVIMKQDETRSLEDILAPYEDGQNETEFVDITYEYLEIYKKEKEEILLKFPTFENFMDKYCRLKKEPSGCYGYLVNPNAKFNYYEIGGRYKNLLVVRDSSFEYCHTDVSSIEEIDFEEMMKKRTLECSQLWEDTNSTWVGRFIHGINKDESKEDYVSRKVIFSTNAVVTPDGKWHSEETVNEWTNSFYETFIVPNNDCMLIIVECCI
jgi:hypothetical protein